MNEFINNHYYLATLIAVVGLYVVGRTSIILFALFVAMCRPCVCKTNAAVAAMNLPAKPEVNS